MRAQVRAWMPPALLLAGLLALWEVWVAIAGVADYVLPAPSAIVAAFVESAGLLPAHLGITLAEALLGLLAGAVLGAAVAALVVALPLARRVLYPLLVASQTVPMIVLAPLLVLWFGFGIAPKVVVVALISFFPVAVSTIAGLLTADRDLLDLVRSMGAGRRDVLRLVLLPSALPAFFAGLRIAATYAVAGAVIGEWVGAERGLGIFITRSQSSFQVDRVFVAVAIVTLASIALFGIVHLLSRVASPWLHVRASEHSAGRTAEGS